MIFEIYMVPPEKPRKPAPVLALRAIADGQNSQSRIQ